MLNIGDLVLQLTIATAGTEKAEKAIERIENKSKAATVATTAFSLAWQSATGILGGAVGVVKKLWNGIFNLKTALLGGAAAWSIKEIVNVSAAFEGLEASMYAITGTTEAAAKEFAFAKNQALRLGIDIQTLTKQYIDLMAATKGTSLEGDSTKRVFLSIAEAGRVMQLSQDKIREAFLAVQQMMSKGTVQAEEVRKQLGNALPAAFSMMADAYAKSLGKMNLTTEEKMALLEKDMKKGMVRASSALLYLSDELINKYGAGLDKALSKTRAVLGRLGNEWQLTQKAIGDAGLLVIVKGIAKQLINIMQPVRDILSQVAPQVAQIVADMFKTDQPKDYFNVVKEGFITILESVKALIVGFSGFINDVKNSYHEIQSLNPWSNLNKQISEQEDKLKTINHYIEKTQKSLALKKSLGLDVSAEEAALKVLNKEASKASDKLNELLQGPGKANVDTSTLDKLINSFKGVKKSAQDAVKSAADFAGPKPQTTTAWTDFLSFFKDKTVQQGINYVLNGLNQVVSAQLNAYQQLASYHKQMAQEALNYGKQQSEMWMQLADTVYYSNNAQAQSFQDRAVAAAEAAAKQYQAEKAARDKANSQAKKAFETQKQLQIAQALMSTGNAVAGQLGASPVGPWNIGLATAMGALGAAQVALISKQQFTPREKGGSITGGKPYLVGEKGPELIVPGAGGTVVNNKDLTAGLGGNTNITFQIQALDTSDGAKVIYENRGMIINIIKEAQNNNMGRGV